jgi:hypothetical protein
MTLITKSLLALLFVASACAADRDELQSRRQRAAATFPDGVLLVHARSAPDEEADGFRQDPAFYYFTGLENTVGAILAIDGRSRESWLFLPARAPYGKILSPEGSPDSAAVRKAGVQHVSEWSELEGFLAAASGARLPLYYVGENAVAELPPNLRSACGPGGGRL